MLQFAERLRHGIRRNKLDKIVPLVVSAVLIYLLSQRLADLERSAVLAAVSSISFGQWLLAGLATLVSYWAVGHYDRVMHRLLRTGYHAKDAIRVGIVSIALAQVLGFGALTGAFVRWRLLSCTPFQAAKIAGLVAVSFLVSAITIASLLILMTSAVDVLKPLAWAGLVFAICATAGSVFIRDISLFGAAFPMPSLRALGNMFYLTLIDLAAAGFALWILLPAGHDLGFMVFVTAFIVALGAGLISNAPGGLGAFELTLLSLVPLTDPLLLSAILAYRLTYYVIPAIFALVHAVTAPKVHALTPEFEAAPQGYGHNDPLKEACRAEAQVVRQDGLILANRAFGLRLACHSSHQTTVMLGDPVTGDREPALALLQRAARQTMTTPILYKVSAEMAAVALKKGWATTPIAQEAMIDTCNFDPNHSACRQLRRKLRKADAAGVLSSYAGGALPWAQMHEISALWCSRNGGERGVSTGRFEKNYIKPQRAYIARCGTKLVGFITLHTTGQEWALDLIRLHPAAPDGTVHRLICNAISDAEYREVTRLSLSAAPFQGLAPKWQAPLRKRAIQSGRGLLQFKTCFNPEWLPLYAAAPSHISLAIGLADLARDIRYPGPIGRPMPKFHDDYDHLEFAS